MADSERLRIAVFIDFDNIEIGVKNTLGASFDAGLVLEALKERGEVVSKTAYSDWQRAGGYSRALTQHAIRMVQRNLTPGGDKNGADINLALDALEMAFTHPHINAFVIVGGDSDFISLVEKLKQYDKKVFVVGGKQFSSLIMQRNCHEFIAYENLLGTSAAAAASGGGRRQGGRDGGVRVERTPIEQAIPLVTRGLKVLSEREVSPQLGLLKSTLLQLDSTFSERSYGAGSFRDFVQKLEKIGVVHVHHGKGGLLVELTEGGAAIAAERAAPVPVQVEDGEVAQVVVVSGEVIEPGASPNGEPRSSSHPHDRPSAAPEMLGTAADGIREFANILATAQIRRWPMYLRNVKQVLRQTNAAFDERAYGFANLTDLLRAAHRENVVRVDRDRQGVIRIFQGSVVPRVTGEVVSAGVEAGEPNFNRQPVAVDEAEPNGNIGPSMHTEALDGPDEHDSHDGEAAADDVQPQPVDDQEHGPDDVNGNVIGARRGGRSKQPEASKKRRPRGRPAPARAERPARGRKPRKES